MKKRDYKVYSGGEFIAACMYAEDAAAMCARTWGTTVKYRNGRIIYRELEDAPLASNSWDDAAHLMHQNVKAIQDGKPFKVNETVRRAYAYRNRD